MQRYKEYLNSQIKNEHFVIFISFCRIIIHGFILGGKKTGKRKLRNFYEKVTDFLSESYVISKSN